MAKAEENTSKPEVTEDVESVKPLDTKQKAAVVVVSLGADKASQIHKY